MNDTLFGRNFGRLTVLSSGPSSRGYWDCVCRCGKTCRVHGSRLLNRETQSCGCLRKDLAKEKAAAQKGKPKVGNRKRPHEWLYNILKSSALKRFGSIGITYEQFLEFVKITSCHYCDELVVWPPEHCGAGRRAENYNLDRKNNNLGYEIDNVVVCCIRCNEAKGNRYHYNVWKAMTAAYKEYKKSRLEPK